MTRIHFIIATVCIIFFGSVGIHAYQHMNSNQNSTRVDIDPKSNSSVSIIEKGFIDGNYYIIFVDKETKEQYIDINRRIQHLVGRNKTNQ